MVGLFDKNNENTVFDTVIVVTDRKVLDAQIRNNIKQFEQVKGVVEAITEGSKQLKTALEGSIAVNEKRLFDKGTTCGKTTIGS